MPDTLNVIKKSEQGLMDLIEATPEALEVAPASHGHDAAEITSGIISLDRLPPTEGVVVASGNITTLTAPQQAVIVEGTMVTLGTGEQYRYKGSGSKTDLANYVAIVSSIGWDAITDKPALEPALGNPGAGNWFLKTVSAVRSWVQLGALAFLDNISDAQVANGAAIAWTKINKSGAQASDVGAATASHTHSQYVLDTGDSLTGSLAIGLSGTTPDPVSIATPLSLSTADYCEIIVKTTSATKAAGIAFKTAGGAVNWGIGKRNDALSGSPIGAFQIWDVSASRFWMTTTLASFRVALDASSLTSRELAGTGTRPAAIDSTGKIVDASSIGERLIYSDFGRTGSGDLWQSAFTDNSNTSLKLAANTIQNGTKIRIEQEIDIPWDDGAPYQLALGPYLPAGTGPSWPRYAIIIRMEDGKYGRGRLEVTIEFLGSGASMEAYVTATQLRRGGVGFAPVVYAESTPIPFDATVDRWLDIQFNPNTHLGSEYIIRRNRVFRLDP